MLCLCASNSIHPKINNIIRANKQQKKNAATFLNQESNNYLWWWWSELWNSVLFPFSLAWHQELAGPAELGLAAAAMNRNPCHRSRIISVCRPWLCVSEITKTHLRKKSLFFLCRMNVTESFCERPKKHRLSLFLHLNIWKENTKCINRSWLSEKKSQQNLQSTSHSCPIIIDFTAEYCVIIHPKMISVCVHMFLLLNLTAIFFTADAYICG